MGSGRGFNDLQRLDRRIREPLFAAETKWMPVVEDASLLLLLHLEQHAPNPLRILLVVLSPRAPCWAARFWYKRQQFIEGLGCFFPFGNILFQLVKEFASHVQSIENVPTMRNRSSAFSHTLREHNLNQAIEPPLFAREFTTESLTEFGFKLLKRWEDRFPITG